MGVPAFFRWLCLRCPKLLVDGIEPCSNDEESLDEIEKPSVDIDNLYLDMNSLIHPCTHPENQAIPKPLSETEMFNNIYSYIDKIMSIIQPKALLYLAIDGVAPRAKMNQQRSRRFRSALESKKLQEKKLVLRDIWRKKGISASDNIDQYVENSFDSNVITPGTEFMSRLSKSLQGYVNSRLNSNPLWKNIKVFYSDASVPGEGEHKILDFIRQQRALANYNPNTKHCLYGADADLIMLGLATHEAHFYIFRETIMTANEKRCTICYQTGHFFYECKGEEKEKDGEVKKADVKEILVKFQYVRLSIMREYLDLEFKYMNLPFMYNLERIIDDFVFMCFFVGNDFIPHLPTLDIRAGGIDCLLYIYKRILPFLKGYLTDNGEINLIRVDVFLQEIGSIEEIILQNNSRKEEYQKSVADRRKMNDPKAQNYLKTNKFTETNIINEKTKLLDDNNQKNRLAAMKMREEFNQMVPLDSAPSIEGSLDINKKISNSLEEKESLNPPKILGGQLNELKKAKAAYEEIIIDTSKYYERFMEGLSLNVNTLITNEKPEIMKEEDIYLKKEEEKEEKIDKIKEIDILPEKEDVEHLFQAELKQMIDEERNQENLKTEPEDTSDKVLMSEIGYKERYYTEKFKINPQDFPEFKAQIQQAYVESLCWTFAYYYKGCISWKWFYPYHYAPFASDLEGLDLIKIRFDSGEPLKPLDQLLGVLSPLSSHALPSCLRFLMLDPTSEIIDFYPEEFVTDCKGKKFAWMGEVLLPFMEEERLLKAISKYESLLSEDEQERNKRGNTLLFVSKEHNFIKRLTQKFDEEKESGSLFHGRMTISYEEFGLGGFLLDSNNSIRSLKSLNEAKGLCYVFLNPPNKRHDTNLLEGVVMPEKELTEDLMEKIDRKFYAGNQTIRMLERALGSSGDNNELFNKGYQNKNNEQINRGHFNNNYAHNDFNNFFNNNRAMAREPNQYKTPQVLSNWQNRSNRPDNNIYNNFNQNPNQGYKNYHNRNPNNQQYSQNYRGSHQQQKKPRPQNYNDDINNYDPGPRKKKF